MNILIAYGSQKLIFAKNIRDIHLAKSQINSFKKISL